MVAIMGVSSNHRGGDQPTAESAGGRQSCGVTVMLTVAVLLTSSQCA